MHRANSETSSGKQNTLIGFALHLLFLPLFVMSVLFFKERLYGDPASDIYNLINSGRFEVIQGRAIILVTQVLPMIGLSLGLKLKALIVIYSAGMIAYFYGLFIIALHVMKDKATALMIIALQVMGVLHIFYVLPMQETYFATALIVLFYAYLRSGPESSWKVRLILSLWTVIIINSHPTSMFMFCFIILFEAITFKKQYFYLIGVAIAYWIFEMLTLNPYEGGLMSMLPEQLGMIAGNPLMLYWEFNHYPLNNPLVVFCWISVNMLYLYKRDLIKILLVNSFVAGILILIVATAGNSDFSAFNGRAQYLYVAINIFILVPFFYDLLASSGTQLKRLLLSFFVVLMLFKMYLIYDTAAIYTTGVEQLERISDHADTRKGSRFLIDAGNLYVYQPDKQNGFWSLHSESMLISTLEDPERSIMLFETSVYQGFVEENDTNRYNTAPLNPKYFTVSNLPFESLNEQGLNDSSEVSEITGLSLDAPGSLKANTVVDLPVVITNSLSKGRIYSNLNNGLELSYVWRDMSGTEDTASSIRTHLEVDVIEQYQQPMKIKTPNSAGEYLLSVGLHKCGRKIYESSESLSIKIN